MNDSVENNANIRNRRSHSRLIANLWWRWLNSVDSGIFRWGIFGYKITWAFGPAEWIHLLWNEWIVKEINWKWQKLNSILGAAVMKWGGFNQLTVGVESPLKCLAKLFKARAVAEGDFIILETIQMSMINCCVLADDRASNWRSAFE